MIELIKDLFEFIFNNIFNHISLQYEYLNNFYDFIDMAENNIILKRY